MKLDQQLHLVNVDKELHDAYNCTLDAFEIRCLHEYPTLMWCADAKVNAAAAADREGYFFGVIFSSGLSLTPPLVGDGAVKEITASFG